MSKARDEYYDMLKCDSIANDLDSFVTNYVSELEYQLKGFNSQYNTNAIKITDLKQQLKDSEWRCKLHEDAGILLSKKITELEQQKAELIECLEKSIRLLEDGMCDFCDEDFCDIMSDCILQELKQYLSKHKIKNT